MSKSNDKVQYIFSLPADYVGSNNPHHYLSELKPHLYFSKRQGKSATNYLLESFEQSLPRYQLKKRLRDCVGYLNDSDVDPLVILFVCATTADLLYVKRSVRKLIDDNHELQIRATILDKIKASGITSTIWEEI